MELRVSGVIFWILQIPFCEGGEKEEEAQEAWGQEGEKVWEENRGQQIGRRQQQTQRESWRRLKERSQGEEETQNYKDDAKP